MKTPQLFAKVGGVVAKVFFVVGLFWIALSLRSLQRLCATGGKPSGFDDTDKSDSFREDANHYA